MCIRDRFNTSCSCESISENTSLIPKTNKNSLTSDTPVELFQETPKSVSSEDSEKQSQNSEENISNQNENSVDLSSQNTCIAGQMMITRDNDPSDQANEGVIDSQTTRNLLLLDSHSNWGVPQCDAAKNPLSFSGDIFKSVSDHSFSCIDGRVKEKGLSALGGDAGEFLLGLSVFSEYSKKSIEFSEKEIQRMLEIYLNKMRSKRFYMCTDQESFKNVETAVGSSGFSLKNVKKSLQKHVLDEISKSGNVGSIHIKKMMGKF